ncbi:hypothetical protein JD844_005810 [Phrynosoma platyrhinos]|uniref:Uncharacterized protein n=1 Tax=Phrynosoma platyrhinos TaxID=52577 RepID=A0ABQ7TQ22_PHRPL|nr:hypothetical protein JD844_005810 [Phrynosoma platyrhinos]
MRARYANLSVGRLVRSQAYAKRSRRRRRPGEVATLLVQHAAELCPLAHIPSGQPKQRECCWFRHSSGSIYTLMSPVGPQLFNWQNLDFFSLTRPRQDERSVSHQGGLAAQERASHDEVAHTVTESRVLQNTRHPFLTVLSTEELAAL